MADSPEKDCLGYALGSSCECTMANGCPAAPSPEIDALAEALCREYHPMNWDVAYGNRSKPCGACRVHAARLVERFPDCEGWMCQSCGADNFIPTGFSRVIPPVEGQS